MFAKKQLIVNSFGSFDSDWSKKSYKLFYSGTANAIAAIHRYLDEGAEYSICQAPADLSASDAVLQMSTILSDRPILLAETGAVQPRHSGKWRYYDADKSGAIFHDFFYTPFFLRCRRSRGNVALGRIHIQAQTLAPYEAFLENNRRHRYSSAGF